MRKARDITGKKFGRLTAVKFVEVRNKRHYWRCNCECGVEKVIRKSSVMAGSTKSCGCYMIEKAINSATHRMGETRFYTIWANMKGRCLNPNHIAYKYYQGSGIKVCKRWKLFINFRDDLYKSYEKHVAEYGEMNTTIDRRNNEGNYEPNNCRWSTRKEQMNNTRHNLLITYKGKTQCMLAWAEELGIKYNTLYYRLNTGWPIKKALSK